jgi:hypothetical protein
MRNKGAVEESAFAKRKGKRKRVLEKRELYKKNGN